MRKISKEKLNLFVCVGCFVLSLLLFAGTTFAYFTDTQTISNTIVAGNVKIQLTEAAVKEEMGHLVEDPSQDRVMGGEDVTVNEYGRIYPGMTIYKDPTITNVGDDAAWIAAKITISDGGNGLDDLIGYPSIPGIDIKTILSGGLLDQSATMGVWNGIPNVRYNDNYAIIQKADHTTGTYEFYVFILQTLQPNHSVTLFDQFEMPAEWTSGELKNMSQLTIHVQAYGVQLFDMTSCYQAMTTAFASEFSFPASLASVPETDPEADI